VGHWGYGGYVYIGSHTNAVSKRESICVSGAILGRFSSGYTKVHDFKIGSMPAFPGPAR